MTVRVQGPSSRLSEELTKAKRKIGKFASTLLKSETEYDFQRAVQPAQMPLPFWTNIQIGNNVGRSNSETYVDEGNRRFILSNGNNGPNASARMHGVLRGPFELHFELGYLWGWSEIILIPAHNWDHRKNRYHDYYQGLVVARNNNSNNVCQASWVQYDGLNVGNSTQLTGFSSGLFKFWRDTTGMIYFRPPNGTDYATQVMNDDLYVIPGSQSPNWARLNAVVCDPEYYS